MHFRRNIRKNIQKNGLQTEYQDPDGPLQRFVRLLWTTSLVPARHIAKYYENVVLSAVPEFEEEDTARKVTSFLDYFQQTYIGMMRNNSWREPRFAADLWSKYKAAVQCKDMDTNKSEVFSLYMRKSKSLIIFVQAFNRHLSAADKRAPNLWSLIMSLIMEESIAAKKISDSARGEIPSYMTDARAAKVKRKKAAMSTLAKKFDENKMMEYGDRMLGYFEGNYVD